MRHNKFQFSNVVSYFEILYTQVSSSSFSGSTAAGGGSQGPAGPLGFFFNQKWSYPSYCYPPPTNGGVALPRAPPLALDLCSRSVCEFTPHGYIDTHITPIITLDYVQSKGSKQTEKRKQTTRSKFEMLHITRRL